MGFETIDVQAFSKTFWYIGCLELIFNIIYPKTSQNLWMEYIIYYRLINRAKYFTYIRIKTFYGRKVTQMELKIPDTPIIYILADFIYIDIYQHSEILLYI